MFAPLKTWRRWHRKVNLNQKRHAAAAAVAASGSTPIVLAKGHHIQSVPELPLVVDSLNVPTTKDLLKALQVVGLSDDLLRARKSKKLRAGKGKARNGRFTIKKGPLVIYGDANLEVKRTARNLPGVDTCHVSRLNLLQLAPGGQLGRLIVWTKDAFEALEKVFGSDTVKSEQKTRYQLPRTLISCADLARLINSDQIQEKLRAPKTTEVLHNKNKKNPLKNRTLMQRLNPFDAKRRELVKKQDEERQKNRKANLKKKRQEGQRKAKIYRAVQEGLQESYK